MNDEKNLDNEGCAYCGADDCCDCNEIDEVAPRVRFIDYGARYDEERAERAYR